MKKQCERSLNYGIIGNCRSGALVSDKGAIEWLCLPKFDSGSVFGKLLDEEKGGSFEILPETETKITQKYDWNTNILITRFACADGTFEVHDFMPRYKLDNGNYYTPPDVIRYFKHIDGTPTFRIVYDPRLEYARHSTQIDINKSFVKAQTAIKNLDKKDLFE